MVYNYIKKQSLLGGLVSDLLLKINMDKIQNIKYGPTCYKFSTAQNGTRCVVSHKIRTYVLLYCFWYHTFTEIEQK